MAPTEEAPFITRWQAGTEQAEIGRQLGIPRGTVSSRAMGLVRQGKIQPRPKGGAYPRSKAQGRDHSSSSVQRPVQTFDTGAVHSADTGAAHCTAPIFPRKSRPLEFMDTGCDS